jgi:hypothetical protein
VSESCSKSYEQYAKYPRIRIESKDWLVRNQDTLSKWSSMSTHGLQFQWTSNTFCPFSFGHCVVCLSIYGFWLPLWYLVAIVLSVLLFMDSDYPLVSCGHCVVCPSIYGFWLPILVSSNWECTCINNQSVLPNYQIRLENLKKEKKILVYEWHKRLLQIF